MARLPRLTVPGLPHHIIQRGNNRQPIFVASADYQFFLDLVREHATQFGVAVHAYALMPNHVHLLATPQTHEGLPKMMQAVGRRYVRYFNDRHRRTGTLWEGRYRSTMVQTDRYLMACMVYIDLNPVRAGLVPQAADYPWSSHGHYAGLRSDPLVTPHPLVWALGNTPFAREAAYVALVQQGVTAKQSTDLTQSALLGWALGDDQFVAELQRQTPRRVSRGTAGRPTSKPLLAS